MARCKRCRKFSLFGFEKYQDGMCRKCWNAWMDERSAFHEMQRPIHEAYFQLDNKFRSFRITSMSKHDFEEFYSIGIELLKIIPQYVPMMRREEELCDLDAANFYENIPIKLLDYCCRFGEIEKGHRVISILSGQSVYLPEFCIEQSNLFYKRERAVRCAVDLLKRKGELSKPEIIKEISYVEKEDLQWAMRFYKGFATRKEGSKYYVSIRQADI